MVDEATDHPDASYGRRLLHRWLVQYNPIYLLSAALVLGGMILCSRGLAREGSLHGEIGVAAIADLYAAALIGGAALLTRIGQRRPAVMLALLTALYQCDLTLHTETCAYLGSAGAWAAAAWVAIFVAKLYGLAWAMCLRLSRSAAATATFGALGLAVLPHLLHRMDPGGASTLVALWLFALFAAATYARPIGTADELDAWRRTVLRRSLRAAWLLWSALLVSHVLFWSTQYHLDRAVLVFIALLLAARALRKELGLWVVLAGTLALVDLTRPGFLSVAAAMTAVVLGLRGLPAVRSSPGVVAPGRDESMGPYRVSTGAVTPSAIAAPTELLAPASQAARLRLLTGAFSAAYLAVWMHGWSGGPWPAHLVSLDLLATAAVLLAAWKARAHVALVPLAAAYVHLVVQARLFPTPRSTLEWGVASVGLGFGVLIASLGATYWLRNLEPENQR